LSRERRVLIIEDSALMGRVLSDSLGRMRNLSVSGIAKDSREAWSLFNELKPDVITLDLMLPDGSGFDLLERIMKERPTPVVVISSLTKRTAQETFKAYDLGAVDVIEKPKDILGSGSATAIMNLGYRVLKAADVNISVLANMVRSKKDPSPRSAKTECIGQNARSVVLVASSTGGPNILTQMIGRFGSLGDAAMVIVQHMPPMFTASLAARLDRAAPFRVKEASDGDVLTQGTAYIAPGGLHLELDTGCTGSAILRTTNGPQVHGVKPSADVTFRSFAEHFRSPMLGVVLSGMGSDGADGCRALKDRGVQIISQNKETCVVYGMPRAVEEGGLSDQVLPHMDIPQAVERWITDRRR